MRTPWDGSCFRGRHRGGASLLLAMFVRIRRRRMHLQERFGRSTSAAVADQGTGGGEKRLQRESEASARIRNPPVGAGST